MVGRKKLFGWLLASAVLLGACGQGAGSQFVGAWFDSKGKPVDTGVLAVVRGCDDGVVFAYLGWPPGTPSTLSPATVRLFIRDPSAQHIAQDQIEGTFDADARLPSDATASGFHRGDWELWLSPSDERSAYLVSPDRVERWPRSKSLLGCA